MTHHQPERLNPSSARHGDARLTMAARWIACVTVTLTVGASEPPPLPVGNYRAPAKLETATFIGSSGSEWLSGGVFLPDGRILLTGVSQDPELTLGGVRAKVVGEDAPPFPVRDAWEPLGSIDTGKIAVPDVDQVEDGLFDDLGLGGPLQTTEERAAERKERERQARVIGSIPRSLKWDMAEVGDIETADVYRKMSWVDEECTAFWGIFSADLRTVHALWRLPRGAGSITSAGIADDGTVYIAGGASDRITRVGGAHAALPPVSKKTGSPAAFAMPHVYIARLTADYDGVRWLRTMRCEMLGPKLRVLRDGDVTLTTPDIRRFAPDGTLKLESEVTRSRYPDSVSINPLDGSWCKGGDFLTRTGREPWREPYFFIYLPDGTQHLELWRWRGPFAAIDALGHLVADAQVAKTAFDEQGNLIVTSRSHGGNCVQIRYPYDLERMMPNPLGGIPANSPGCVVKLDRNFQVIGSGVYSDPGFFNSVGHGVDGSVVLSMRTARGGPVGGLSDISSGPMLAILSPDLHSRRFQSVIPGAGKRVAIAGRTRVEDWATVTGWSEGRPKLLLLSGAVASERMDDQERATPLRNPVQATYAGGRMDGYALLFDLSPGAAREPTGETPMATEDKRVRDADPPVLPEEGQAFRMGYENYATVHVTIRRMPEEGVWPRFYYGRAERGGHFAFATNSPTDASFRLVTQNLEQRDYDQSRRALGARLGMADVPDPDRPGRTRLVPDPRVEWEVTGMSAWRVEPTRRERETDIVLGHGVVCDVTGILHMGQTQVPFEGVPCHASFRVPRKVDATEPGVFPNHAILRMTLERTGAELGFADEAVRDVRYSVAFSGEGRSNVHYAQLEAEPPPDLDAMKPGMETEDDEDLGAFDELD